MVTTEHTRVRTTGESFRNYISYFQMVTTLGVINRARSAREAESKAREKVKNSDFMCGVVSQTPFELDATDEWIPKQDPNVKCTCPQDRSVTDEGCPVHVPGEDWELDMAEELEEKWNKECINKTGALPIVNKDDELVDLCEPRMKHVAFKQAPFQGDYVNPIKPNVPDIPSCPPPPPLRHIKESKDVPETFPKVKESEIYKCICPDVCHDEACPVCIPEGHSDGNVETEIKFSLDASAMKALAKAFGKENKELNRLDYEDMIFKCVQKVLDPPDLANTCSKLPQSFDARDWAKEFVEMVKKNPSIATDEGTMLAWFSGSLMSGYDTATQRIIDKIRQ